MKMSKFPKTVFWHGEDISDMDADRLRGIIIELVQQRDDSREAEYQRQIHAFDYIKGRAE